MSKAAKDWAGRQAIDDGVMKPVLQELAYRHTDGKGLFLSQATLAFATGNTDRSVRTALRLLQHFGVLRRKSRSNGAGGRSSDEFTLALDGEFTLNRTAISTARTALSKRKQLPVAGANSQPEAASGAPGTSFRGIDTLVEGSIPSKGTDLRGSGLREADDQPTLKVILGGRP